MATQTLAQAQAAYSAAQTAMAAAQKSGSAAKMNTAQAALQSAQQAVNAAITANNAAQAAATKAAAQQIGQQQVAQAAQLAAIKAANAPTVTTTSSSAATSSDPLTAFKSSNSSMYGQLNPASQTALASQLASNPKANATQIANNLIQAQNAYSSLTSNPSQSALDSYTAAAKAAGITPQDTSKIQSAVTAQQQMSLTPNQANITAYQQAAQAAGITPNSAALKSAQQTTLNSQLQAMQGAGNKVTQSQIDSYNSLAQQYGLPAQNTSSFQNTVNQTASIAKAQANFTLPTGDNSSTTTQTTTDPSGNKYTYVPSTSGSGQWYKDTGNGAMQAVDSKGTAQTNSPVIPQQAFTQQLSQAQNTVTQAAQQAAQTAATGAFNASPEESAYQSALSAFNAEQSKTNPDPTQLQSLYNNLNTAQSNLQKSAYSTGQYTTGAIQGQTTAVTNAQQELAKAQAAAQQAAAQQAQQAAAAKTASANEQTGMSVAQQDVKSLNAGGLLGDTSKFTSTGDYVNAAQTAYQNALNAYNSYSGSDVNQKNQLAQNLQNAATLNKDISTDLSTYNPAASQNLKTATQDYTQAAQSAQAASKAVDASQIQQYVSSIAAQNAAKNSVDWKGDILGTVGIIGMSMMAGGLFNNAAQAADAANTAATMASDGASQSEIANTLSSQYGLSSDAATQVAGQTADAVTNGVTQSQLTDAGFTNEQASSLTQAASQAPSEAASSVASASPVEPTPITSTATTAPVAPEAAPVTAPTTAPVAATTPVAPETVDVSNMTQEQLNQAIGQVPQPGPGVQVASTEPGAGLNEAANAANQQPLSVTPGENGYNASGTTWTDASGNTYPVENGATRIEVSGVGTEGAAPTGEAASGTLSPVTPSEVGTLPEGATSVSQVTPVDITAPTTAISPAAIAAGAGAAALAASAGGGAAAAPVAATPTAATPVAPTTAPVTATPVTTPTTAPVTPTTTPTTAAPVTPTTTTAPVATTTPTTPVAPLSPVQQEVIPAGTTSVAPATAQTVAPTDGLAPVSDATVTPVSGAGQGVAGAGGVSATDLALLAGGASLAKSILTPPTISMPGYAPVGPVTFGTQTPPVNPGLNPGYLMGKDIIQPQLQGQGTQANYYWGGRPLVQNAADWNTAVPAGTQAWGATQAAGTGKDAINLNNLITETLGINQARSATPYAIASPVAPANYAQQASTNNLVNQTLGLNTAAAGGPIAPFAIGVK